MDKIKAILRKYSREDYRAFADVVEMLCTKGVRKGCFNDITMLVDVMSILYICEDIIKGD